MDISENSENHLKAIVGGWEVAEVDGLAGVPKYRHENGGAKGKRRRVGKGAGSRGWRVLVGPKA